MIEKLKRLHKIKLAKFLECRDIDFLIDVDSLENVLEQVMNGDDYDLWYQFNSLNSCDLEYGRPMLKLVVNNS